MNTIINLDGRQRKELSQILGRYLSKSSLGRKIIGQFQENRERGVEALVAYLDTILPRDRTLAARIAHVLEQEQREDFVTIVTSGGSVGEIINVRQLDKLQIRYYLFSDVKQVIALLVGVVMIGSALAFGQWWSRQPRKMTGDFNIAVAEFVSKGDAAEIAPIVSQRIFSFLSGQYMLSSFQSVQVEHNKIGAITNAEEARALAEKINAHLVIYGDAATINDQVLVTPQIYVIASHQADLREVNGEHKLAAPISLPITELTDSSSAAVENMQRKTRVLTEFTKALVYLAAGRAGDLALARDSIMKAITEAQHYADFPGKEVLYLFASDITRRQGKLEEAQQYLHEAMQLNADYGRGYIAQANIYYDQGNYYLASQLYTQAAQLNNQTLGAYIREKASMGLGNICLVQYQYAQRNEFDTMAATDMANCALQNFQTVIDSYNQQPEPEDTLRNLASGAYFSSGVIYQKNGQLDSARFAYEQALKLVEDPEQKEVIQTALDEVREP